MEAKVRKVSVADAEKQYSNMESTGLKTLKKECP